jgi:hypothetical protein
MSKRKDRHHVMQLIRQAPAEVILKAAGMCDGHSILKPQVLVEAGLPRQLVQFATRTYRSDGTPKGARSSWPVNATLLIDVSQRRWCRVRAWPAA